MPDGIDAQPSRRVEAKQFQDDLTGFLQQVRDGASFLITSDNQVLAEIRPVPPAGRLPRKSGAMKGRIWMAEDFDEFPPEVLDAMEGDL